MKRQKGDLPSARRLRLSHVLTALAFLYLIVIMCKFPKILELASVLSGDESYGGLGYGSDDLEMKRSSVSSIYKDTLHRQLEDDRKEQVPLFHPEKEGERARSSPRNPTLEYSDFDLIAGEGMKSRNTTKGLSVIEKLADEAWTLGLSAWEEVKNYNITDSSLASIFEGKPESCPLWVYASGGDLARNNVMFLPCGLIAGSSITVVGTPHYAHKEYVPQLVRLMNGDGTVYVSQFMVELQGLKVVEGEAPPKILHLNPRIRGDWSRRPVIELNTCYRMQWGGSQRCDGSPSRRNDDMLIDGFKRCEKWMHDDINDPKESKTTSWFKRFIGREQKPEVTWPYPFAEGKMFILTIRAGIEGYHITSGGRHVASFPYRTGFTLEDATGLAVQGDIDVHSVYATSLPTSHPSFSPQKVLEMSPEWKSPPSPTKPVYLFVGVLSATNHFAERMAVRKTWLQSSEIRSSDVVVRFFVALNPRKEVNAILYKEAAYFGDIVILPFMDRYELVVLKTIAICQFGIQNVTAKYIMKCDDDTFVRLDAVLKEIRGIPLKKPLYMGNLNLRHRPLRHGKWAVTYEEWPELIYPPYANGPGYVITVDIAKFVVAQRDNKSLRLFKMEDVSMGMWVEQFNRSTSLVQYSHSWKFCQYGCMEGYYTAHYQSPRQMICLWSNLKRGRVRCCNFR